MLHWDYNMACITLCANLSNCNVPSFSKVQQIGTDGSKAKLKYLKLTKASEVQNIVNKMHRVMIASCTKLGVQMKVFSLSS